MLASLNLLNHFVTLPLVAPASFHSKKSLPLQNDFSQSQSEPDSSSSEVMEVESAAPAYDLTLLESLLTRQGFEIESIKKLGEGFEQVVVGLIEDAKPHPHAERLKVCRVNVGASAVRQIVCGAANAREGMFVAVALPGATLPGGLNIQETTIRGVESRGMLCSRAELGLEVLSCDGDGIWELQRRDSGGLPESELRNRLGQMVFKVCGLCDVLFELSVTPNRPDALCHLGVAREIYAGLCHAGVATSWHDLDWIGSLDDPFALLALKAPKESLVALRARELNIAQTLLQVSQSVLKRPLGSKDETSFQKSVIEFSGVPFFVENRIGVPAFFVGYENVTPAPSPGWLRKILEALGQSSINDVVDISNFILLIFGQPSHAFDLDKIGTSEDRRLVLRTAHQSEKFKGLDGKERELTCGDCVVADVMQPQALLGVIGGELSKVDFETTRLVVEWANPDAVPVRRTSRRIGRKTDSSFQFEKGLDRSARFLGAAVFHELLLQLKPGAKWVGAVPSLIDLGYLSSCPNEEVPGHQIPRWSAPAVLSHYVSGAFFDSAVELTSEKISHLPWVPALDVSPYASWIDSQTSFDFEQLAKPARAPFVPWNRSSLELSAGALMCDWAEQLKLLGSLGFVIHSKNEFSLLTPEAAEECFEVYLEVPQWRRLDVASQADISEEILRVVGIDLIPGVPMIGTLQARKDDAHLEVFETAATVLTHLGYTEISSFHFMRENDLEQLGLGASVALGNPVRVLNPIIADEPLMQTTLLPDLLRKVRRNINYGTSSGRLFHICRTYQDSDSSGNIVFGRTPESENQDSQPSEKEFEQSKYLAQCLLESSYSPARGLAYSTDEGAGHRPVETPRLAGLVFGDKEEKRWNLNQARQWVLHDLMGHISDLAVQLATKIQFSRLTRTAEDPMFSALHPGRCVKVDGVQLGGGLVPLGWVGEIHPRTLRNFEIDGRVFGFELNLAEFFRLHAAHTSREKVYYSVHRLPLVRRDFAFLLDERVEGQKVKEAAIAAFERVLAADQTRCRLTQFRIFDVYMGDKLPVGKKSMAFQLSVEPLDETLSDAWIQKLSAEVIQSLEVNLGAVLRGGSMV